MGGTRQGESLVRIAENLVKNGRGGTSQTSLSLLGRRLLSIDFVVFLCCFKDLGVVEVAKG